VIIPSYENIDFESFDGKRDKRFNRWEFDAFHKECFDNVNYAKKFIEKACISENKYTPLKYIMQFLSET
jgi:hypothetical protein